MRLVNRREAGAAALTLIGAGAATADDKNSNEAEKKRIMEAGLTDAEADCWIAAADAAGKFFTLPKLHEMDAHEVAHAIHVVQHKLLSRPAYRKYLEIAKAQKK